MSESFFDRILIQKQWMYQHHVGFHCRLSLCKYNFSSASAVHSLTESHIERIVYDVGNPRLGSWLVIGSVRTESEHPDNHGGEYVLSYHFQEIDCDIGIFRSNSSTRAMYFLIISRWGLFHKSNGFSRRTPEAISPFRVAPVVVLCIPIRFSK